MTLLLIQTAFAQTGSAWKFQLAPQVWGISIDGDSTLGTPTAPVELDFQDSALENLETGYGLVFESKKDEFTLFTEVQYADLTPDVTIGADDSEIDLQSLMVEIGSAYIFSDSGNTTIESLFGFRYLDQEIDVDAAISFPTPPAGPGPQTAQIEASDNWWHPFMGLRLGQRLGERWSLLARSDFGYLASDNKAVNASAIINFRFTNRGSMFAGYRYMDFDYDEGNGENRYAYQAVQQGPLLGFNIHW